MVRNSIAAVVAACGIATFTPATPAAAHPVPPGTAVRIVLDRSGGFAGRTDTFVVSPSTAGGEQPLRLAGSYAFTRLRGSYLPRNSCCDRFSYRVEVSYRGGFRK